MPSFLNSVGRRPPRRIGQANVSQGNGPLPPGCGAPRLDTVYGVAHSDEELRQAALDPVGYELDAMAEMTATLARGIDSPTTRNAYIEAMLVHARSLIGFLDGRGRRTDIRPSNFLHEQRFALSEPRHQRAEALFDMTSKWLAHMTWERAGKLAQDEQPGWLLLIAGQVLDMFDEFMDALREHNPKAVEWFSPSRDQARRRLQQ